MFENAIALTGSIATGKSTLSALLKMYGYRVIDADSITHEILNNSKSEIESLFGAEYIEDGKVNRAKLGSLIFSDSEAKKKLEEYMHPRIKAKVIDEAEKLEKFNATYFVDIPLFFETANYDIKRVLVVYAPKDLQLARLIARGNLSKDEALKRIESQINIEKKRDLASFIIDNSKDLKSLQDECEKFVNTLKGR
jgi:dephospho-CoA kinase